MPGQPITTKSLPDATLSAVRALFDYAVLEQNQNLYYKELGYRDYEPDKLDEQGNSWSGPGKGNLTVEGQDYGDNTIYRGLTLGIVLLKSFLIYGENLVVGNALQAA